jgi:N6-adenosine-specific RNA methylase IME4
MGKYQIIYADPPWEQSKGGKKSVRPISSGGELAYPTLTLTEIKRILFDATLLSDIDCNLFLWTIDKYLFEAQKIAEDITYKLHARLIWNKVTGIPASFDIRFGHEYLLWLYKGKLQPVAVDERGKIHSVFTEQVKRHSQKPEIAYQIIERLYPDLPKLELFARNKRIGWDSWGNEVDNDIEI